MPTTGKKQKWPKSRQDGNISPTFSRVPTAQHRPKSGQDGYTTLLGGPLCQHGGKCGNGPNLRKMATEPCLLGSLLLSTGKKSEMAQSGKDGYITPAFLRIPGAQHKGENQNLGKMATLPSPSRGAQVSARGGVDARFSLTECPRHRHCHALVRVFKHAVIEAERWCLSYVVQQH